MGRTSRRFCSSSCSSKAKIPPNLGRKFGPSPRRNGRIHTCIVCGTTFYRPKQKDSVVYCSQSCYLKHRWQQDGVCKECGKPSNTRFCSRLCQKAYWNKHGYLAYKHSAIWNRKLKLISDLGGECIRCGNNDPRVLDIHHKDPNGKVRPKEGAWTWSRRFKDWEANKGNLELLCANCHRIATWKQRAFCRGVDCGHS